MKILNDLLVALFAAHFFTLYQILTRKNMLAGISTLVLSTVFLVSRSDVAHASIEYTQTCDTAAQTASRESGVPLSVLQAITRTETGRKKNGRVTPWPWTVNMEGKGMWFDNEDEARAYVFRHFKRGARSFDVGCFQINYKWHGQAFKSIEEMFEPLANARYAAKFLQELYAKSGNWSDAAGAYHSRTPKYANRYKAIFKRYRASLQSSPSPVTVLAQFGGRPSNQRTELRINRFPLLQAGIMTSQLGSLVPLNNQGATGALFSLVPQPGG